jgi:hypothetical protein
MYYLELGALEGTLSSWPWLHLQSLAPTPFPRRVEVWQVAGHTKKLPNLYHNMM